LNDLTHLRQILYTLNLPDRRYPMDTLYEAQVEQLIDEAREELHQLQMKDMKRQRVRELGEDIVFLEQQLKSYKRGLAHFRTQSEPKPASDGQ